MLVPIAFVNEHIETLHEMDIEYCKDLAKEAGVEQIERAAAPNDHPIFIDALTDIVTSHLSSGLKLGSQFTNRFVLGSHIVFISIFRIRFINCAIL